MPDAILLIKASFFLGLVCETPAAVYSIYSIYSALLVHAEHTSR